MAQGTTPDSAPSVIHAGMTVHGAVSGEEELHVAGTLDGDLHLQQHLSVHPGGHVLGVLNVESAAVAGAFTGVLVAQDYIVLHDGATGQGELRAPRVILEAGCNFKGQIDMDVPLPEDL